MKDEKQLKMEIQYIFDSGTNEIRIFEMVKHFIEIRYSHLPSDVVDDKPHPFQDDFPDIDYFFPKKRIVLSEDNAKGKIGEIREWYAKELNKQADEFDDYDMYICGVIYKYFEFTNLNLK